MKPWSKLQSALYNIMRRDEDNFQIHCVAYRMPESLSCDPQIPRYYITTGKGEAQQIIFDFPGNHDMKSCYSIKEEVPQISNLIREYIDSPRKGLAEKVFENDKFGLTDILKQYDRRFRYGR